MYRYKKNKYCEYLSSDILKDLYLDLPEDFDSLRELFELSVVNNIDKMFDRIIDEEKEKENIDDISQYNIEIGWHSPFELFFEAISILPDEDKMTFDKEKYQSIICSMLSAKHGEPIGIKYKKLIEVAHNIVSHYPRFYGVFKSICFYYGHYDVLKEQDKEGKLLKKELLHKNKINIPDHTLNGIIEFLCPLLNGRLLYVQEFGCKAKSEDILNEFFHPVKIFSIILNSDNYQLKEIFTKYNNNEIFTSIKNYLRVRAKNSNSYSLKNCNTKMSTKIICFIIDFYDIPPECDCNLCIGYSVNDYKDELNIFIKYIHFYELERYILKVGCEENNDNYFCIKGNYDGLDNSDKIKIEQDIASLLTEHISCYSFDEYKN